MAAEKEVLRDWHRLFGLLLTDFFTGSPFVVDVERDLSVQQQLLDVVIVRRRRGRFAGRLPDGLEGLVAHNLITFKSHREALDAWAMKELVGHYVAYRKLVSPAPSELLPEGQFRLYAVVARLPHVAWLMLGHWSALRLFGVLVPPAQALTLLPILFVVSVLPIAPSGIGTTQATAIALFAPFSVAATQSAREASVLAYALALQFGALLIQAALGLGFLRRVTKAVTVGKEPQAR